MPMRMCTGSLAKFYEKWAQLCDESGNYSRQPEALARAWTAC